MKTKLISITMLLFLAPSLALAARPSLSGLQNQVNQLSAMVEGLTEQLAETQSKLEETQARLDAVQTNSALQLGEVLSLVKDERGQTTVVLTGVNLQLLNGLENTATRNGLGNLIIGYNAIEEVFADRFGSHNLIVGDDQTYGGVGEVLTKILASSNELNINTIKDLNTAVGGDAMTQIAADNAVVVGGGKSETVGTNHSVTVGAAQNVTVGAVQTTTVGNDQNVSVGANRTITVGVDRTESVANNATLNIGNDASLLVEGLLNVAINDDAVLTLDRDLSVFVGKKALIDAGDEINLKTGTAAILMKKNGDIDIKGKNVDVRASGDVIIKGSKINEN